MTTIVPGLLLFGAGLLFAAAGVMLALRGHAGTVRYYVLILALSIVGLILLVTQVFAGAAFWAGVLTGLWPGGRILPRLLGIDPDEELWGS